MSKLAKLGLVVVALLVVAAGAAGVTAWRIRSWAGRPIGLSEARAVTVPRGARLKSTITELAAEGVIEHPRWLYLWARVQDRTKIRAGEYLVEPSDTPSSLLDKLASGKVRTEQVVIVEGHNRWQVRDTLTAEHWMTPVEFDRLCDDPAFLARHGVPGPTCDGYLFPDTYTLARGLAPEAVLGTMIDMFRKVYGEITAHGRGPLDLDERQLTTLASIVEKETGSPEERPHVACVFYNRLKAKPAWRLETDPTVIYAARLTDPAFDGNLKREHLRKLDNPYNTYRVFGLPPGPIANPGRAAFEAVVAPTDCKDFFFVSRNDGTHVFCPTLGCHNQAVGRWQVQYFRRSPRAHKP